jgi:hypothetical protein
MKNLVSAVLAGARGFKRHPLAPDPHPRSVSAWENELLYPEIPQLRLVGKPGAGHALMI